MRRILFKEIGTKSIYNDRHIFMLSLGVTVAGFALTLIYSYMVVRLILFAVIMAAAFINRAKAPIPQPTTVLEDDKPFIL